MKPEIKDDNLYVFLFNCIEYVNYFNEINDEQFNKRINQLRDLKRILESEV